MQAWNDTPGGDPGWAETMAVIAKILTGGDPSYRTSGAAGAWATSLDIHGYPGDTLAEQARVAVDVLCLDGHCNHGRALALLPPLGDVPQEWRDEYLLTAVACWWFPGHCGRAILSQPPDPADINWAELLSRVQAGVPYVDKWRARLDALNLDVMDEPSDALQAAVKAYPWVEYAAAGVGIVSGLVVVGYALKKGL